MRIIVRTILPLLLFAALLPGCATLGGKKQAIAVNSMPRGIAVAINDSPKETDPSTPLAATINRDKTLSLFFHADGFEKQATVACTPRYGTVFGGNIPLSLVSLSNPLVAALLYGAFVGVDFYTGAAYECPYVVEQALDVPESILTSMPNKCEKVLLLPPQTDGDLTLTSALLEEAKQFAKRGREDCLEFVSMASTAGALERSSLHDVSVKQLLKPNMERRLAQLLRDTSARQAVEMSIERFSKKFVTVKFDLWDLYAGNLDQSFQKNFQNESFERLKGGFASRFVGRSLRLVPNSVAILNSVPELSFADSVKTKQKLIGAETSFFGLLNITNVQHPDQYDTWDVDYQFGPSLYFNSIRHRVQIDTNGMSRDELQSLTPDDLREVEFRGYSLGVPLDLTFSFHTPAGAFRVFVGYGLGFYLPTSNTSQNSQLRFYDAGHFGADWVAYMTNNLFFQFGAHSFIASSRKIETQNSLKLAGWTSLLFGVGYYMPSSQGYLESMLTQR